MGKLGQPSIGTEAATVSAEYTGMTGPSFRFRLERVRALRERREDAAKQALAGALDGHRHAEEQVQAAADRIEQARAAQLDATSGPSDSSDLMARQAYLERAERAHLATRHDLAQHELELERHRAALSIAARDRQALERLKEQRRADHDREQARREGLELDEIAIKGFLRRAA
jgi:flagellar protein FliJ